MPTFMIQLLTTQVHMLVELRAHPAGTRGPATTRPVTCTAVITKKRDPSARMVSYVKQMKDAPWPRMTQKRAIKTILKQFRAQHTQGGHIKVCLLNFRPTTTELESTVRRGLHRMTLRDCVFVRQTK